MTRSKSCGSYCEEIAPLVVGRIADQDVDVSGRFEGACDEFFAAIAMEDVGFERVAGAAELADTFGGLGKVGAAGAIVDHQVGAVLGQFQAQPLPIPRPAPVTKAILPAWRMVRVYCGAGQAPQPICSGATGGSSGPPVLMPLRARRKTLAGQSPRQWHPTLPFWSGRSTREVS